MDYPNEQISKEICTMIQSLEDAKEEIKKKYISILEDFNHEAFERFDYHIESGMQYGYERWIRQTCDEIVEGLLSGDTRWLKHQNIISEYSWDKLKMIRLAILKSSGGEIENCTIKSQQEEIEKLKKDLEFERKMRNNY